MRRREFIGLVGGAATAWPFAARAQQPALPVIGYFSAGAAEPSAHTVSEFRKGLAETGYAEGLNVQIEYRWANNQAERLSELAADLIRMPTDVVANFISEQVSADDLLILGILAPGYLLAIPVTAFLAKRGLFIGKNADGICFPGDQGGSGIYYSKEREILTSVGVRVREVPIDLWLLANSVALAGLVVLLSWKLWIAWFQSLYPDQETLEDRMRIQGITQLIIWVLLVSVLFVAAVRRKRTGRV